MHILMIGTSCAIAPVAIRERAAFPGPTLEAGLRALVADPAVDEAAILSTCNRTELYAAVPDLVAGRRALERFLAQHTGTGGELTDVALHGLADEAATTHLLRVAAGLESQILGEGQILGQVREAHRVALTLGAAGPVVDALFRAAIRTGKRARAETGIARGAVSTASAAVALAKEVLGGFDGKSTLLVGAGSLGELAARLLAGHRPERLLVANRTDEAAMRVALEVGGTPVPFTDLGAVLAQVDLALCCTGAPEPVLTRALLAPVAPHRSRPLLVVDLAVPRNVEPAVADLPGIRLADLDDLDAIAQANRAARGELVAEVLPIVAEEAARYAGWRARRRAVALGLPPLAVPTGPVGDRPVAAASPANA